MEEIKDIMEEGNFRISHIMREGNKLADYLVIYALDTRYIEAHGFEELEVQGKRIVNSDKLQCPYIRIRVFRS